MQVAADTSSGVPACGAAAELAPGGEVLLCSGTVANPQLLMLSGIGPAAKLSDAGVQMLVDAPGVGANLQDHPATLWAAK
jgi:choline dehydrogenase-like flavoprotein